MRNSALDNFFDQYPIARPLVNWGVTVVSVWVCLILLPSRLPGMELAGIGPNWLLVWVVAWSVKRSVLE
ncbi:MAG: rod shape-determining protein MreD, partial [Leptolyngbyaceae cyanobacterium SU_3_3]|nr:rod shape-determining protein MreD [Leptolyngbyaceae cyanobacterium SU_3_3]